LKPPVEISATGKLPALDVSFFSRPTVDVARELLGQILVREGPQGRLAGRIVETEAYTGADDPASHAFHGPTARSRVMFGVAGRAYVYLCYGFHFLLNVVSESEGQPGAVLLRAIEPCLGLETMLTNRNWPGRAGLCDGPGKLTRALEVDLALNGWDMTRPGSLYVSPGGIREGESVLQGPRIGITRGREHPWRFRLIRD